MSRKIIISVTNDISTDQRIARIASTLQNSGYLVTIVGRLLPGSMPIERPYSILRFRLPVNKGPLFYALYNLRLFLFLIRQPVSLFWSCDLDALPANYLASKIRRKPLIYDSHELFTEVPELVHRPTIKKIWEIVESYLLKRIHFSCTVSCSISEYYKEKYKINMEIIRNLPYHIKVSTPKAQTSHKIIIYQGALNLGRGIEKMILTMKYLDNHELWICGTGDIENQLIDLVKEHGLSEKVKFKGRLRPEELKKITPQADLGLSLEENLGLNYYYALPNKLFDYIQAQVPVIVSDFPEMSTIVNKFEIGCSTLENDPLKLAKLISGVFLDTQQYNQWKVNLQKASIELCWENEDYKVKDLVAKALNE